MRSDVPGGESLNQHGTNLSGKGFVWKSDTAGATLLKPSNEIQPTSSVTRQSTTTTTLLWYWCQARIQIARRLSGRKHGQTGARTELGPYFVSCESFSASSDMLWSQTWLKVITAGRPERTQRQEKSGEGLKRLKCKLELETKFWLFFFSSYGNLM